ncbi:putative ORFan [Tupanvirus deep ocean]|uniref:ORFan n=1 Tax=Tupanvirus soda lake TaxID=2126985 RepID=A0A2K9L066_9VIRU|nr:putative ORFan [Tupanvirus deep ocean]AUL78880.2 putative ORFan [Tupanvirus deep ocean]
MFESFMAHKHGSSIEEYRAHNSKTLERNQPMLRKSSLMVEHLPPEQGGIGSNPMAFTAH